MMTMATGIPKTQWTGNELAASWKEGLSKGLDMVLTYEGKRTEEEILSTPPAEVSIVWPTAQASQSAVKNRLYYGDNLPILAALLRDGTVRGQVRLVYIDPPFTTRSVFQSRSQADAYADLLAGARYVEFLRERLILLRELMADDGSIYVHLDENMAFHIKVVMDEVFGPAHYRNWITRKKCNPKNYTRRTFGNVSDYLLFYTKSDRYVWHRPFEGWTGERAAREYSHYRITCFWIPPEASPPRPPSPDGTRPPSGEGGESGADPAPPSPVRKAGEGGRGGEAAPEK